MGLGLFQKHLDSKNLVPTFEIACFFVEHCVSEEVDGEEWLQFKNFPKHSFPVDWDDVENLLDYEKIEEFFDGDPNLSRSDDLFWFGEKEQNQQKMMKFLLFSHEFIPKWFCPKFVSCSFFEHPYSVLLLSELRLLLLNKQKLAFFNCRAHDAFLFMVVKN